MPIIQLYARKSDLIYSEPEKGFEEEIEALSVDIKQNGIIDAVKCKSNGYICKGNTRVQATDDEFIPIDLGFFIGLMKVNTKEGEAVALRRDLVMEEIEKNLTNRSRPVKPANKIDIPIVKEKENYIIDLSDNYIIFNPVGVK